MGDLCITHAIQVADPGLPIQLDLNDQVQSQARQEVGQRIDDPQRKVGGHAPVRIAVGPIKERC
jgi:hypothetical protein